MTGTLVSDVSITLTQRRWACVLDPALALSIYGLPLVKQLSELMELWIVREFWHMLDNPQFYVEQPEALLGKQIEVLPPTERQEVSQQMLRSLQEWERLRLRVDPTTRNINFLADVIGESFVPAGADSDLIWRWESLAQSLDGQIGEQLARDDVLTLAYRDLAALAAARPACILTHRTTAELAQNQPPRVCSTLTKWGIACQEIGFDNVMADIEQNYFRSVLVHAGVSKFLWSGLNLSIIHLVVPAAATLGTTQNWSESLPFTALESSEFLEPSIDLWQGAQGFWYSLH
ncbi:hypothetical protein [Nodosilinea sp. FACHB-13]|uniref:hypothetical protein n=1 Tax=Cyanophyceae TaxID=3028117 RepID=UPI0016863BA1|nr:hypothetical protein [Nodosilinea sp. FACHB-13]MBD2108949.1 hypothetical protein [Nodosilinea sp. FACHB-13]